MLSDHRCQVLTSLLLPSVTMHVLEVSFYRGAQGVKKVGAAGLSETVKTGL